MQTYYHKSSVINAITQWAEKAENKADIAQAAAQSDGVIQAALTLGQAVSQVISELNFIGKANSPVKSTPLTIGLLNDHFNTEKELVAQSESCVTHNEAISVQSRWPEGGIKQYFRIARDNNNGQYLFARTDKENEIVDGNRIQAFKDQPELTNYLRQELPSFM